jgi:hypothetical protein
VFRPVSRIEYRTLLPEGQVLVCTLAGERFPVDVLRAWEKRAAAVFPFREDDDVTDVIRDVLANPQIRAIVFADEGWGREAFERFWARDWTPEGASSIKEEHLEVVREFVDLYDRDCGIHSPMQPFWPERLLYKPEENSP